MKWKIENIIFEDARTAADHIMENCEGWYFDDMLDECYAEVEIFGCSYAPSLVLREVDPIAYRCARSDWEDSTASDMEYELERMNEGDAEYWYGFDIVCIDDTDDEDEDE